ncbi:MAG: glycerate kinase type-2 family protein [Alphaproteobacteria bacterium]
MFDAAVAAANPDLVVPPHLPEKPQGRVIILGAGKASAAMAKAAEEKILQSWGLVPSGLVVTQYGAAVSCQHIEIVEANHPVPDANGMDAAERILAIAESAGENDLVLFLVSGGGSSLLPLPGKGLTLDDKQAINKALLKSGAAIHEMNVVRKHLSAIKGGRLAAAAYPARLVTLGISDVPGDDFGTIASGPTIADPSTVADAIDILGRYKINLPQHIAKFLEQDGAETPDPSSVCFRNSQSTLVAKPQASLEAAADVAKRAGYTPLILGDAIEGEAQDVGLVMAGIAKQVRNYGQPAQPPLALISGGETTVSVNGPAGRGGRNTAFLLSFANAADDMPGVSALACDTDGIDGTQDNAGALYLPGDIALGHQAGRRAIDDLSAFDSYSFFEAINRFVMTGPTLTNVNDLRVILIDPV